ncbi:hypothetical protein [Nannocystis pusilla]|uniref:hypothetical protein n=1 Tax=Nannocystis pusilla TaxID=889268 RepID=UPI003B7EBA33
MSYRNLASGALACAALLACGPNSGETTAGETTAASTSTTTSTTSDPEPSTGPNTTSATSTTTTTGPACGEGWCASKDVLNIVIHDNHEPPHELVIPAGDVKACELRTYSIQGAADHDHTITLTPELFLAIDGGGQFELESTEAQGHTHTVWGDCE